MNNKQNNNAMNTFSNNPIIVAQVNAYIVFLSCTKQDAEVREMSKLVANDNRIALINYLEETVIYHAQFTTNADKGREHMAKSLLNLIRMF